MGLLFTLSLLLAAPQESFDQMSARLLKQNPDDPHLLLLCADWKDPAACRKLAARRTPVFLAAAVDGLLERDQDPATRAETEQLLRIWADQEPDNGMPLLYHGTVKLIGGDLPGALHLLEEASRKRTFREHDRDARVAVRQTLREKGVDDIVLIARILGIRRHNAVRNLHAFRILSTCAEEERYRGRSAEAARLYRIQLDLCLRILEDDNYEMGLSIFAVFQHYPAEGLYSVALEQRRFADAARIAAQIREVRRQREFLHSGLKRMVDEDPLEKMQKEAGLDLPAAIAAINRPETLKPIFAKYDGLLREREKTLRPLIEAKLQKSERDQIRGYVRDEDRKAVAEMKFPIDRLEELQSVFYPEKYGPEARAKVLAILDRPFDEKEGPDLRELLGQACLESLVHHADRDALPSITDPVVRAALGDTSQDLVAELAKVFEKDAAVFDGLRALAKLGRKEFLGSFLASLKKGMADREIPQIIGAAYALRDLTGRDFGVDVAHWEKFAADQPDLFKK